MHLFIDLTAALGLKGVPNALIAVSKEQWLELNEIWPEHCYGDPESVSDRYTYDAAPRTASTYRVDITGLFGLSCLKEGNPVLKDQCLAIAKNPDWRPFCFGNEILSAVSGKKVYAGGVR